jgi:hypothetical protein
MASRSLVSRHLIAGSLSLLSLFALPPNEASAATFLVQAGGSTTIALVPNSATVPTRSFWGPGLSVGALWALGGLDLGPSARVRYMTPHGGTSFGVAAVDLTVRGRTQLELSSNAAITFGANAGAGVVTACIRGDYCGGAGPIVGVEAAFAWAATPELTFEIGAAVDAQFGLVNLVRALFLPGAHLGVRF